MIRLANPASKTAARSRRALGRQKYPASKTAVPPIGDSDGRVIRQRWGKPPARRMIRRPLPPRRAGLARGCKGRSPLHKKTKKLPLPRRGRGLGG